MSSPPQSPSSKSGTVRALKLFEGFRGKEDLVRVYVEAQQNFTSEELDEYTATFIRFDVNKSGDLDKFELNKFYEAHGETKTAMEISDLIKSIGDEFGQSIKEDGVTFGAYLSVLLKDKKGQTKDKWGTFAKLAKQHDDTKATGKIANVFEKKAAEANAAEEKMKADIEMRRANRQLKEEEAKSKAEKQAALAKFNARLASRPADAGNQ